MKRRTRMRRKGMKRKLKTRRSGGVGELKELDHVGGVLVLGDNGGNLAKRRIIACPASTSTI